MARRAPGESGTNKGSSLRRIGGAANDVGDVLRERQRPPPNLLDALTDLQEAADRRVPDGDPPDPASESSTPVMKLLEERVRWRFGVEKGHDVLYLVAKAAGIVALLAFALDRLIA